MKNIREDDDLLDGDDEARLKEANRMVPRFEVGEKLRFDIAEGNSWLYGIFRQCVPPGDPRNPLNNFHVLYKYMIEQRDYHGHIFTSEIIESDIDQSSYGTENSKFSLIPKNNKTTLVVRVSLVNAFHDLDLVGIDTCSAVSVSTEKKDFIFIDESNEAKDPLTLHGVGGSSLVIGGRGQRRK